MSIRLSGVFNRWLDGEIDDDMTKDIGMSYTITPLDVGIQRVDFYSQFQTCLGMATADGKHVSANSWGVRRARRHVHSAFRQGVLRSDRRPEGRTGDLEGEHGRHMVVRRQLRPVPGQQPCDLFHVRVPSGLAHPGHPRQGEGRQNHGPAGAVPFRSVPAKHGGQLPLQVRRLLLRTVRGRPIRFGRRHHPVRVQQRQRNEGPYHHLRRHHVGRDQRHQVLGRLAGGHRHERKGP